MHETALTVWSVRNRATNPSQTRSQRMGINLPTNERITETTPHHEWKKCWKNREISKSKNVCALGNPFRVWKCVWNSISNDELDADIENSVRGTNITSLFLIVPLHIQSVSWCISRCDGQSRTENKYVTVFVHRTQRRQQQCAFMCRYMIDAIGRTRISLVRWYWMWILCDMCSLECSRFATVWVCLRYRSVCVCVRRSRLYLSGPNKCFYRLRVPKSPPYMNVCV